MKGVQRYELFGGITLKNHAFFCSIGYVCAMIDLHTVKDLCLNFLSYYNKNTHYSVFFTFPVCGG